MARLILDTGILVAAARDRLELAELADEDNVALPAVAVAEYLTGVELDTDPARQAAQRSFLDDVLGVLPVVDYDIAIARAHARLLAHTRRSGHRRGPRDLLIAATATATDRTLLTTDTKARFDELPGVDARVLDG